LLREKGNYKRFNFLINSLLLDLLKRTTSCVSKTLLFLILVSLNNLAVAASIIITIYEFAYQSVDLMK